MRLSFMTFACPDWSLDQVLGAAREIGYEGVEPRMDSHHQHGIEVGLEPDDRAAVRKQAADEGVELCCLATSLQFIKFGDEEREQLHNDAVARIELAADLGIPGLRVFGGKVPEGRTLEQAIEAAAENLRAAGEVAAERGVALWLETHDTFSRAHTCCEVIRHANHPAVGINYDMMHPLRNGEDLDTVFSVLPEQIPHCHFHDGPEKLGGPITRLGEGELPLVEVLQRLQDRGFDGYLSGEWFNDQLGATPEESIRHYHDGMVALLKQAGVR